MRDSKDPLVWLNDIVESADLIQSYIAGVPEEEFFASTEKQDSVARRLEIIGEAVKNLPEEFKAKHPHVAWSKAAGMRNVLIHEYFDVDHDITWDTLQNHLPVFKQAVQKLMHNQ
jgi:uncharacterized protein with HEPN domain